MSRHDAGQILQTHLKGHKESVLCLAYSGSSSDLTATREASVAPSCLLSGAEDGTARLWDLRYGSRAALCLLVPQGGSQEVTSVAFAPPPTTEAAAASGGPFSRNFSVYLSVGTHVYCYDLRNTVAPVVREYTHDLSNVLENPEEVNQISFSKGRRNQSLHLATANDCDVRVTDSLLPGSKPRRSVLHHDPDGLAVVTSVEFRPRAKGLDLTTGGTDCNVHLWDVTRPRRPSSSYQVTQDDAGANQVCNPPMVNSLAFSPSGRLLAAGLGDGTCSILRLSDRRLVEVGRLRDGHDAAVASVVFPEFGASSSHVVANDRLLASAGNDGAIFLWDLGAEVAGDGAADPSTLFAEGLVATTEQVSSSLEAGIESLSITNDRKLLFGIPHQQKPNWLVSSGSDQAFPSSLFVADTTSTITAYTLPLR